MNITDLFVIPEDVSITPVGELPDTLQRQIGGDPDDVAISRQHSRTTSKVVDGAAAALLQRFRTPTTIVNAVLAQSKAEQSEAETLLDAAFPLLQSVIQANLLVPANSISAKPIAAIFHLGDRIGDYEIVRLLQTLDDTDLYQVRDEEGTVAALKIARPESGSRTTYQLQHEADVLRSLPAGIAAILLDEGEHDGHPYLVVSWVPGIDAQHAAQNIRRHQPNEAAHRPELGRLALNILRAYAALHATGVAHGDIHPRNLLVDQDLQVTLIDFGVADRPDGSLRRRPPRAGVSSFFEPEYATSVLDGLRPPAASFAGEQYALAALLYQIFTQHSYVDFEIGREEMFTQIADANPLPFSKRNVLDWSAVETVLNRALQKEPGNRFPSVAAFAAALAKAIDHTDAAMIPLPVVQSDHHPLIDEALRLTAPDGAWFRDGLPQAPTASLKFGAAGIAFALYRMARALDDGKLLARADLWLDFAAREAVERRGYENEALDVTIETVGDISPLHAASGVPFTRALIAAAKGDGYRQAIESQQFVTTVEKGMSTEADLTLGKGSLILATTSLLNLAPNNRFSADNRNLLALGDTAAAEIAHLLDGTTNISAESDHRNLGIAHGWAGYIYAMLRWCESTNQPVPSYVHRRLDELAQLAEPHGRGVNWKWELTFHTSTVNYIAGWCNGSAGHLFLWALADRLIGNETYRQLAEGAAWQTWDAAPDIGSLCCGAAGRAYALLAFYNHTQDAIWLHRARMLANEAAMYIQHGDSPPQSLYKGLMGVAVLLTELEHPADARMPFFEREE